MRIKLYVALNKVCSIKNYLDLIFSCCSKNTLMTKQAL